MDLHAQGQKIATAIQQASTASDHLTSVESAPLPTKARFPMPSVRRIIQAAVSDPCRATSLQNLPPEIELLRGQRGKSNFIEVERTLPSPETTAGY